MRQNIFRWDHKIYKSKTNNKSPGNNGHTGEFYTNFSNELAPVIFDVYDSWGKLGTRGVTSRLWIMSVIYKKVMKKVFRTTDPFYF